MHREMHQKRENWPEVTCSYGRPGTDGDSLPHSWLCFVTLFNAV